MDLEKRIGAGIHQPVLDLELGTRRWTWNRGAIANQLAGQCIKNGFYTGVEFYLYLENRTAISFCSFINEASEEPFLYWDFATCGAMTDSLISVLYLPDNLGFPPERALGSLVNQSYPHWELIVPVAPDDRGSLDRWNEWANVDRRIRVSESGCTDSRGARLNEALHRARGELIAYFDSEAAFASDFFEAAIAFPDSFDVLLAGFDVVVQEGTGAQRAQFWDPDAQRSQLFVRNITRLFGVVHRREILERIGGFHELLLGDADWDVLKRFARIGAEFVFVKSKAGTLSPRMGNAAAQRPTEWQRAQFDRNRLRGQPIFGPQSMGLLPRKVERILFSSVHCLLDFTNGASLAVLQAFRWLQAQGFQTEAFCLCDHTDPVTQHAGAPSAQRAGGLIPPGVRGDVAFESENREGGVTPAGMNPAARFRPLACGGEYETVAAGIPVTVRQVEQNDPWQVTGDTRKFLAVYERLLNEQRPDVVVTYGGDCLSLAMMEAARFRDIPVVFWLHNFGYPSTTSFQFVNRVIVPSEFSREYHWNRLGLDCCAIPNFIDWQRVQIDRHEPSYVTFVNPERVKGGFVFAAIARELATRRPEIPLLVVEGRSPMAALKSIGLDLGSESFPNVTIRPRTADPREFYAVSKLVLMPSLWNESFGLVAAEAMINGIPVIASDRGALPEVVGDGGILLNIPARYTPVTQEIPTAEEIEPWITAIIDLWDNPDRYQAASDRARSRAEQWRPENIGPQFAEFFANVSPEPAPPVVIR